MRVSIIENENVPLQLHDRLTRGEFLSPEETAQVEAWYAREDAAENLLLNPYLHPRTDQQGICRRSFV